MSLAKSAIDLTANPWFTIPIVMVPVCSFVFPLLTPAGMDKSGPREGTWMIPLWGGASKDHPKSS